MKNQKLLYIVYVVILALHTMQASDTSAQLSEQSLLNKPVHVQSMQVKKDKIFGFSSSSFNSQEYPNFPMKQDAFGEEIAAMIESQGRMEQKESYAIQTVEDLKNWVDNHRAQRAKRVELDQVEKLCKKLFKLLLPEDRFSILYQENHIFFPVSGMLLEIEAKQLCSSMKVERINSLLQLEMLYAHYEHQSLK